MEFGDSTKSSRDAKFPQRRWKRRPLGGDAYKSSGSSDIAKSVIILTSLFVNTIIIIIRHTSYIISLSEHMSPNRRHAHRSTHDERRLILRPSMLVKPFFKKRLGTGHPFPKAKKGRLPRPSSSTDSCNSWNLFVQLTWMSVQILRASKSQLTERCAVNHGDGATSIGSADEDDTGRLFRPESRFQPY